MQLKLLNEYPQLPLDENSTIMLCSLLMGSVDEDSMAEALSREFIPQVIQKRWELAGIGERFRINPSVLLLVTMQCRTPGVAVMYAHTLKELALRKGAGVAYTIDDLVDDFPHGFPGDVSLREAWDAQKRQGAPGGNYLDTQEAWT